MKTFRHKGLVLASALLLSAIPAVAAPENKERQVRVDQENLAKLPLEDQQRVLYIADRLETIAHMDRSAMSRTERRAIRAELKGLKQEAEHYNRGGTTIYLSTGAIIIIILLLIIIL